VPFTAKSGKDTILVLKKLAICQGDEASMQTVVMVNPGLLNDIGGVWIVMGTQGLTHTGLSPILGFFLPLLYHLLSSS
jgi:hypothetical protein